MFEQGLTRFQKIESKIFVVHESNLNPTRLHYTPMGHAQPRWIWINLGLLDLGMGKVDRYPIQIRPGTS